MIPQQRGEMLETAMAEGGTFTISLHRQHIGASEAVHLGVQVGEMIELVLGDAATGMGMGRGGSGTVLRAVLYHEGSPRRGQGSVSPQYTVSWLSAEGRSRCTASQVSAPHLSCTFQWLQNRPRRRSSLSSSTEGAKGWQKARHGMPTILVMRRGR